jgi:hypothetical protein
MTPFKDWKEAAKHLGSQIKVQRVEMPDVIGYMDGIILVRGATGEVKTAFCVINECRFAFWKCGLN